MACLYPLEGWRSRHPSLNGKFPITFNRLNSNGQKLVIACGQCIGCRLDKAKDWSLRIMHEAQTTAELGSPSCFITLTYNDDNLPFDNGLQKIDFRKFIRKLRKTIDPQKVRYYMCGEYGEQYGRPHYHAILFGYDFPDRYVWTTADEKTNYRSDLLESVWQKGNSLIGDCTIQTAGYTARYIMKKANGEKADEIYKAISKDGKIRPVQHEYTNMSTHPGIGKAWYGKYKSDCEKDFLTFEGSRYKIPKYYDKLLERDNSAKAKKVKAARRAAAAKHSDNNTPERLAVRETCTRARAERLPRPLE